MSITVVDICVVGQSQIYDMKFFRSIKHLGVIIMGVLSNLLKSLTILHHEHLLVHKFFLKQLTVKTGFCFVKMQVLNRA